LKDGDDVNASAVVYNSGNSVRRGPTGKGGWASLIGTDRDITVEVRMSLVARVIPALWVSIMAIDSSTGGKPPDAKEIVYRGGVVTYSIPNHWIEQYDPSGGATFYEDRPDTGTLRLNVVTAKGRSTRAGDFAMEAIRTIKKLRSDDIEVLSQGSVLAKTVKGTSEQGHPITISSWYLARSIPREGARVAIFAYTVLSANETLPKTDNDLAFLETSIRRAQVYAGPFATQ
jgi:hypothetical protein